MININIPFDPIERAKWAESICMKGSARAYYRFRHADFYGPQGINTADALGCPLLCAYCWAYGKNLNPEGQGDFFKPSEVALKLRSLSKRHSCDQYRISGSEPFLGESSAKHIANIIKVIDGIWWIETNALMIGYDANIIKPFDGLKLYFRVTIKGHDSNTFEKVTGAKGEYYKYPLLAIKELLSMDASVHVAFNPSFVDEKALNLPEGLEGIEYEKLHHYRGVDARMRARGLKAPPTQERPKRAPRQTALNCDEGMYQDLT